MKKKVNGIGIGEVERISVELSIPLQEDDAQSNPATLTSHALCCDG